MLCGIVTELYLWLNTRVPWTWWVAIGTTVTYIVGYSLSAIIAHKASKS
jgi:hypothetical protein